MKAAASDFPHFSPNKGVTFWVKNNVGFSDWGFLLSAPERGRAAFSVNLKEATAVASTSQLSRSPVASFGVGILVGFSYLKKKKEILKESGAHQHFQ